MTTNLLAPILENLGAGSLGPFSSSMSDLADLRLCNGVALCTCKRHLFVEARSREVAIE